MMTLINQLSFFAADIAPLAVSFFWQSTLLIILAGFISILLRKRGPVIRLSLWIAVMIAIPLIPITMQIELYGNIPSAPMPVLPSALYELNVSSSAPETGSPSETLPAATASKSSSNSPSESANPFLFGLLIYALGAGIFLSGIVFATIRIRLWEKTGKQLSGGIIVDIVNEYCDLFGIKRNVRIIEHSQVVVPCTSGIWRPVIFVPESYEAMLSEEQISSVICHECAHIKRHDVSILAISSVIRAMLWIHPFVWIIQKHIAILAEQSADELVLGTGTNPASYASTLTNIVQNHAFQHSRVLSPIGFIDFKHTFLFRVRAILKYTKVESMSWKSYAILAVSLFIMVSVVTAVPMTVQPIQGIINPDERVTLNLVMKDIKTKQPISGVKLTAIQFDIKNSPPVESDDMVQEIMSEAVTDENGKASLPGIKRTLVHVGRNNSDEYPWVIAKPKINYFRNRIDSGIALDGRRIKSNKTVTLYMERSAVISGTVIDPEGNPVPGATVYYRPARSIPFWRKHPSSSRYFMVETDENGKYSLNIPGNDGRGARISAQDGKLQEWRTWANGTSSETFELKSMESAEDVTIQLTRPGTISGIVKDKDGIPVPDITVRIKSLDVSNDRNHLPSAQTDENGLFTIRNVREGKMFLICNRNHGTIYHPTKCEWPKGYLVPITLSEGETVTGVEVLGLTYEEVRAIERNNFNIEKSRWFWLAYRFKRL